jgi:hypothetical protein
MQDLAVDGADAFEAAWKIAMTNAQEAAKSYAEGKLGE